MPEFAVETPLDEAHAAMEAAPDDASARLRFYERLCDREVHLLLEKPAFGDVIEPRVFALESGPVGLVFDREDRLAAFTEELADYATLPGREAVLLFAGEALTLGINLGVAPSSILLPPDVLTWLADLLAHRPVILAADPSDLSPPSDVPEALIKALDVKLARASGLAASAWLARIGYRDGKGGHLLAFTDVAPGAEDALARAVGEAVVFSGLETSAVDVTFLAEGEHATEILARVGLRFELPKAETGTLRIAPGSDPTRPPSLK